MSSERCRPRLTWATQRTPRRLLRRDGYKVFDWRNLRPGYIDRARKTTTQRDSLGNAAQALLDQFEPGRKVAVTGIVISTIGDLRDVFGYLIEPAFVRCIDLHLEVDVPFDDVVGSVLVDPEFGYGYTQARLVHRAERIRDVVVREGFPPLTPIEDQLLQGLLGRDLQSRVQFGIGPYRADFAFPSQRLVVEADGRDWHDPIRDEARDRALRALGWVTLRFPGWRIHRELDAVLEEIEATLFERRDIVQYSDLQEAPRRGVWRRFIAWLRSRFTRSSTEGASPVQEVTTEDPMFPEWKGRLDRDQRAAVDAPSGVVQIIAPAGSGKTTTMIGRVLELIARGVPQNRIVCTTFNRATRIELGERLADAGAEGVDAMSFHGLGWRILNEAGQLRREIRTMSHGQWRRLALRAQNASHDGVWIEPGTAAELISDFKLAQMVTPEEAVKLASSSRGSASSDARNLRKTAAELYRLYEADLAESDVFDFDDLIIKALWLLREDPEARAAWTSRWQYVLVDEYQDIEPAQELLIRVVASPEDNIFAVGDEDQCIYSWRRASVERIVMLDHAYPSLDRHVLTTSYRCPSLVVEAASQLIERNRRRFPKTMVAGPSAEPGDISVLPVAGTDGLKAVTDRLRTVADPGAVVVLARTTRTLRDVAQAAISAGISINAPEKALRPSEAERTVTAYLKLAVSPKTAEADSVNQSFRVPNRYLPQKGAAVVAEALRRTGDFETAVSHMSASEEWRKRGHDEWANLLGRLSHAASASEFMTGLRGPGGLDRHFSEAERLTPHDQVDIETLDDISDHATGTPAELLEWLVARKLVLEEGQDEGGIELNTIHGSKGREWDTVILYGFDADQLPHFRTVEDATTSQEHDEAIEDERRLAYVAMTRTSRELVIIHTDGRGSPFLVESRLGQGEPLRPFRPASS